MAKSSKEVQKDVKVLKRALGMRGDMQPGDLTLKAREIMKNPMRAGKVAKKLPALHTKEGVGFRGLV